MRILSKRHRRPLRVVLFVLLALLLLLGVALVREPLAGLFWYMAKPLVVFRSTLVSSEVSQLQAKLAKTEALRADRDFLYQENLELKKILGRSSERERVLAVIMERPPGIPYDTLLLDVGAQEGIAPGDLVYAEGSVVVGKISEVYGGVSRATLFSAPGVESEALLLTEARETVPLLLLGQGGGSFMGKLPAGTAVSVGDLVTFAGITPKLLARVSYVQAHEGESFQTLYLHLPVSPFDLRWVEVETAP